MKVELTSKVSQQATFKFTGAEIRDFITAAVASKCGVPWGDLEFDVGQLNDGFNTDDELVFTHTTRKISYADEPDWEDMVAHRDGTTKGQF